VRRFPISFSKTSVPQARSVRDPAQQTRPDQTEPTSTRRSWVTGHDICPGEAVNPQTLPFKLFNLVGSKKTMQRLVSRLKTRKGFTLVELAVVIVIIGVLAAFGVPKFLNSVEKSKASEASPLKSGTWPRTACMPPRSLPLTSAFPRLSISTTRPPSLLQRPMGRQRGR